MKRAFLSLFVCVTLSSLAQAAPAHERKGRIRDVDGVPVGQTAIAGVRGETPRSARGTHTIRSVRTRMTNFTQDPVDDPCGTIDPNRPCYMTGKDPCVKATNYTTCISRCQCQYTENKKKCKMSLACLDIAASEKDACDGSCLTDYM